ncbi:MAG: FecR domain-containing protein [Proteobacteria bacterium]|nr:FecR domain-containing protein [Pseudomonadota bacterium]
MTATSDHQPPDALREEAAAWLIRVQSDAATDGDWRALAEWLAQSTEHRAAYAELEELSFEIEDSAALLRDLLAAAPSNVVQLPRRRPNRWPVWGLAAAAALVVAVVSPLSWQKWAGRQDHYATGVGQTRDLRLADGSDVRMNAMTTLDVRLGAGRRRVRLGDGEASFDVAKDASRPFVISVGDEQVRVVGTAFNIRHYDGLFVLTVSRGIVEAHGADGAGPGARLTVGQELRRRDGAATFQVARVDPATAAAWTNGRMICRDRPLTDIVADLNRRYRIPVKLGPRAAGLRFSGVIELGDETQAVQRLGQFLGLPVHHTETAFTLG